MIRLAAFAVTLLAVMFGVSMIAFTLACCEPCGNMGGRYTQSQVNQYRVEHHQPLEARP